MRTRARHPRPRPRAHASTHTAAQESIESAAELLYGLIHARFIITPRGLSAMLDKYAPTTPTPTPTPTPTLTSIRASIRITVDSLG